MEGEEREKKGCVRKAAKAGKRQEKKKKLWETKKKKIRLVLMQK